MKLSNKEIKEIAQDLDCGFTCYIHKETKEIKTIIDTDSYYEADEFWGEEIKEIESNLDKYIKIEKMSSRESFSIMEAFIDEVSNKKIKDRLIYALNRNKPFKNFKYEVDYDKDIRQQWFKFKANKSEEWVRDYFEDNYKEDSYEK